jgi:hypothetical protein
MRNVRSRLDFCLQAHDGVGLVKLAHYIVRPGPR